MMFREVPAACVRRLVRRLGLSHYYKDSLAINGLLGFRLFHLHLVGTEGKYARIVRHEQSFPYTTQRTHPPYHNVTVSLRE